LEFPSYFVRPAQAVTCDTVAIIIRVVFPHLTLSKKLTNSVKGTVFDKLIVGRLLTNLLAVWGSENSVPCSQQFPNRSQGNPINIKFIYDPV